MGPLNDLVQLASTDEEADINLERKQTAINLLNTYLDRMTPLMETASNLDVYYLSKCIGLIEEIKDKKYK